ncbi:MAG: substrate-binding domain-containing protein, partial [Verrucomicrobiae bacterium]|nr:substrate-binding domain-containing protein [Verrucomicrobiae bacterium]
IFRYSTSDYDYRHLIRQVRHPEKPVTAVFVDCPYQYLNLFNQFLKAGISVPDEVSLVCRQDADFLNFVQPSPAHYTFDADSMAKNIQSSLEARIQGDRLQRFRKLLVPEFRNGDSLSVSPAKV